MEGSDAEIESCTVTVAMHLQPLAKPREEILAPFLPDPYKLSDAEAGSDLRPSSQMGRWRRAS